MSAKPRKPDTDSQPEAPVCPEPRCPSRRRKRKGFARFLDPEMRAAVIGSLVVAIILTGSSMTYHHFTSPPDASTVTRLMNEEAAGALAHDVTVVSRIYAPGAIVTDAGCQARGAGQSWDGYAEIQARYSALPRFHSLQHVIRSVAWEPGDWRAATANVTADTVGVMEVWPSPEQTQPIAGHELWTFVRINGQWLVKSFTYNLCLP